MCNYELWPRDIRGRKGKASGKCGAKIKIFKIIYYLRAVGLETMQVIS